MYEEYKRAKSIVENPCVINDAAERSVRLVSDFLYLVNGKKKIYIYRLLNVIKTTHPTKERGKYLAV